MTDVPRRDPTGQPGLSRGRGSRRRVVRAGLAALCALLGFGARGTVGFGQVSAPHSVHASSSVARHRHRAAGARSIDRRRTRVIRVLAGATVKQFEISEPAGAIRLLRVTVPQRTRVNLIGQIPHVAIVGISTPQSSFSAETCQQQEEDEICTQPMQQCPMPAATWHFRLQKLAGPSGDIRLAFVVGQVKRFP